LRVLFLTYYQDIIAFIEDKKLANQNIIIFQMIKEKD